MRIGYLGPAGSHSHDAAEILLQRCFRHASASLMLAPMMALTHILEAVEEGSLDIGCIPVENALEGSVAEVLDNLAMRLDRTRIIGEFVRPIRHSLIRRFEFLEGISYVHSHPQAIGQCRQALYELLGPHVKFVPTTSTSEAISALLTLDETHAALGSSRAARHYNMEILIENIGGFNQNTTRFLVVASAAGIQQLDPDFIPGSSSIKTSLCMGLKANRPGALLEILTLLAEHRLNMSKIESRPTKKCLGEYLFYLDIEGTIPPEILGLLQQETSFFKCLGAYPALGILE